MVGKKARTFLKTGLTGLLPSRLPQQIGPQVALYVDYTVD